MLIETLANYYQLQDRVTSLSTSTILIWIGLGFYLLAIGVIITIIGGLSLLKLRPEIEPVKPEEKTS
jgi:hypothetical protein